MRLVDSVKMRQRGSYRWLGCRFIALLGVLIGVGLSSGGSELRAQPIELALKSSRSEGVEGTSSREAKIAAIRAIPFDQLTPDASQRLRAIAEDASYFRRMPTQTVECDPEMYTFLVRHPEVVVNIWDVMGITRVTLDRIGEYQLSGDDGAGTKCKMDLVYGSDTLHVYQSNGGYQGNLWARELKGRCVVVLHNRPVRLADGRDATPSLTSLDSQSIKTMDSASSRGIDGGKNVNGRKRFIMVDTLGLVFGTLVCPANVGERAGAMRLLESLKYPLRRLQKILVDKGFSGDDITQWVIDNFDCTWEVSKRAETQKGFVVESKRWVVERTFAWIGKYRRLSKDYEFYGNSSESFIYLA